MNKVASRLQAHQSKVIIPTIINMFERVVEFYIRFPLKVLHAVYLPLEEIVAARTSDEWVVFKLCIWTHHPVCRCTFAKSFHSAQIPLALFYFHFTTLKVGTQRSDELFYTKVVNITNAFGRRSKCTATFSCAIT